MAPLTPAIAVIGLPALPAALVACGYDCLGASDGDTSPSAVAAATRKATAEGRPYVVVVAGNDPSLRSWVAVQVAQGRPVLVATSEQLPFGDPIAKTRTISLPATVDEIMAVFGAPPAGGAAGGATILGDGQVFAEPPPEPEPSSAPPDDDDPFASSPFANHSPEQATPSHGPVVPQLVTEPSASPPANPFIPPPMQPVHDPLIEQQSDAEVPDQSLKDSSWNADDGTSPLTPTSTSQEDDLPMRSVPPPPEGRPVSPFRLEVEVAQPAISQVNPRPVPAFDDHDVSQDAFGPVASPEQSGRTRALVIIPFAGKGGVGKTTISTALAERAVVVGGLKRAVLIDANRGQGDVRKYARLQGHLPSIYDAAISGDIAAAIVDPQRLRDARPGLPDLHIGVVLAPTSDQADPAIVTTEVYGQVIDHARSVADLVVIDTQIIEASDTSGLIDGVIIPLLMNDAWGVGLSDSSMPGVQNLIARLRLFQARGVGPARMMVALNRVAADSGINAPAFASMVSRYGTWMGSVSDSPAVTRSLANAQVPGTDSAGDTSDAELSTLLDQVLYRVTGLQVFAPKPPAVEPARKRFGRRRVR